MTVQRYEQKIDSGFGTWRESERAFPFVGREESSNFTTVLRLTTAPRLFFTMIAALSFLCPGVVFRFSQNNLERKDFRVRVASSASNKFSEQTKVNKGANATSDTFTSTFTYRSLMLVEGACPLKRRSESPALRSTTSKDLPLTTHLLHLILTNAPREHHSNTFIAPIDS